MWRTRSRKPLRAAVLLATLTTIACGFSPSEPSSVDRDLFLAVSPGSVKVTATFTRYTFRFNLTNPATGSPVHLQRMEFTAFASNGNVYGTQVEHLDETFTPGHTIGGSSELVDTTPRRSAATRYEMRVVYTRADGVNVTIEAGSTLLLSS
jgi:hypothetical protein